MWQTGKYYGRWFTAGESVEYSVTFPAGILLPRLTGRKLKWWMGLLVGIAVSSAIEISQLLLCRGLFEFDDYYSLIVWDVCWGVCWGIGC